MLSRRERDIVKREVLYWHGRKWTVHALTVMPDHVHVLATPLEASPGRWFPLSEIVRSIKVGSAFTINRGRGSKGALWQSESFDRIVRDDREFHEKEGYVIENALRAGLVEDPWQWDGLWHPSMGDSRAGPRPAPHPGRAGPRPVPHPGRTGPRPVQACVSTPPTTPHQPRIPGDAVLRRRRKLPHWEFGGATYFLTFRLRK